ncbi:FAD/NAD(P)-binding domain-containing protein [Daldinia caldariorum]|uniref:FAD/NAD(P)-binding domain-containing protein n=1 Tax=Daldinia caldariorum TaxID=326644 RepID=UPI00200774FA|nr:FAD/NAD(P)-binding domain-containing protein [Daldinia caldariorum]KAI1472975.1 FAD/NAD(P)-binding domain-containing protein [Daldinia caldariorum]
MGSLPEKSNTPQTFDFIVVGAGISGINTAYRLQTELPRAKFAVFENRDNVGGTWDLFRYPGVRSDTDLYMYGFTWHPWPYSKAIGQGSQIRQYMETCVTEHNLGRHIRFRHKVLSISWSSKSAQWTVAVSHDGILEEYKARFVILGTGYYDYDTPRQAHIPGIENFQGEVIHPQFWPENFDYAGRDIAVIGSGATAVTLVPTLAKKAGTVTMIQRSPSYILTVPDDDTRPAWMHPLLRIWSVLFSWFVILVCRYYPTSAQNYLLNKTVPQLPKSIGMDPHFLPRYSPWEQRLCWAPAGDFYQALHNPRTSMVTGKIKRVTEKTIEMDNGQVVESNVIILATGLKTLLGGKIDIRIDGQKVDWAGRLIWNFSMIQDIPNMMIVMAYVNIPWTINADISTNRFFRVLKNMQKRGARAVVPRVPKGSIMKTEPFSPLTSTYYTEVEDRMPKYGTVGPWKRKQNVPFDYINARWGDATTGLEFFP